MNLWSRPWKEQAQKSTGEKKNHINITHCFVNKGKLFARHVTKGAYLQ